jgi:hypothetical protein
VNAWLQFGVLMLEMNPKDRGFRISVGPINYFSYKIHQHRKITLLICKINSY